MFKLHSKLENDLVFLGKMDLSSAFLLPDSDNPWVVLVPEIPDITELHQINFDDQVRLLKEVNQVSEVMEESFNPDKLNLGALGNMVPQFHFHIICRFKDDKAWPGSIWGNDWSHDQKKLKTYIEVLKNGLNIN